MHHDVHPGNIIVKIDALSQQVESCALVDFNCTRSYEDEKELVREAGLQTYQRTIVESQL